MNMPIGNNNNIIKKTRTHCEAGWVAANRKEITKARGSLIVRQRKSERKQRQTAATGHSFSHVSGTRSFLHLSAPPPSALLMMKRVWLPNRAPLPFEKWLFYAQIFCKQFSVFADLPDKHINYLLSTRTSRQLFFYFSLVFARISNYMMYHPAPNVVSMLCACVSGLWPFDWTNGQ